MKSLALVLLSVFFGLAAASAQDQSRPVPTQTVSKSSYKRVKKVRRGKVVHRKKAKARKHNYNRHGAVN